MAAIGDGWADGAFVQASWITGAWSAVVGPVVTITANLYKGFMKNVGRLMK